MELKKLFTPVSSMDAEEAKEYIAGHREGDYTLTGRAPTRGIRRSPSPRGQALAPAGAVRHLYKTWTRESPPSFTAPWAAAAGWRPRCFPGWVSKRSIIWPAASRPFRGTRPPAQELNLDLVGAMKPRRRSSPWPTGMEKALQLFYETLQEQSPDRELTGPVRATGPGGSAPWAAAP